MPYSDDLDRYRRSAAQTWSNGGVQDRDLIALLNPTPERAGARVPKFFSGEKRILVDGKTSFRLDVALTLRVEGEANDDKKTRVYRLADAGYVLEGAGAMQVKNRSKVEIEASRWSKLDSKGEKRPYKWWAGGDAPYDNFPKPESARRIFEIFGTESLSKYCTLHCVATLRIGNAPLAHDGNLRWAELPAAVKVVTLSGRSNEIANLVSAFKAHRMNPNREGYPEMEFKLKFKYTGNNFPGADGTDTIAATVGARFFIQDNLVSFRNEVKFAEIRFGGLVSLLPARGASKAIDTSPPRGPSAPPADTTLSHRGGGDRANGKARGRGDARGGGEERSNPDR